MASRKALLPKCFQRVKERRYSADGDEFLDPRLVCGLQSRFEPSEAEPSFQQRDAQLRVGAFQAPRAGSRLAVCCGAASLNERLLREPPGLLGEPFRGDPFAGTPPLTVTDKI